MARKSKKKARKKPRYVFTAARKAAFRKMRAARRGKKAKSRPTRSRARGKRSTRVSYGAVGTSGQKASRVRTMLVGELPSNAGIYLEHADDHGGGL